MVNEKLQSPAARARALADEGAELTHPDMLNEDVRWRSERLFTAEELNFDSVQAAVVWMERVAGEVDPEKLRPSVLNIKRELALVVASERTSNRDRQLAVEVGQWLTVWLQNPRIFADWFVLRRNTSEFVRIFGS